MSQRRTVSRRHLILMTCAVLAITLVGLYTFTAQTPAHAATQSTLYASPTGSGSTCSLVAPCSLTGAQAKVRTMDSNMSGDIVVNLRGGTYTLTSSFTLRENSTTHDSGTNGHNVIYQAYSGEKPLISGGAPIKGWSLYSSSRNMYRAYVGTSLNTRQLYVNGVRANRTRSSTNPSGFTKTSTGWTTTNTAMHTWRNPSDIEIVSFGSWKYLLCGISGISGTSITMKTPCWSNAGTSPDPGPPYNGQGIVQMNSVTWVQNAYELLAHAGDWYYDRSAGYIYYIPRSGDNMATALAIAPTVEKLIDGSGASLTQPLHNVVFSGITFSYATWLQPSGSQGYADNQSGIVWVNRPPVSSKTLGNVSFQYSHNITLSHDTFTHLGGAAIDFGNGAQHNLIENNTITDVSSAGIDIGEVTDFATTDANRMTDGNTIQGNLIYKVGQEYEDACGIWIGYSKNTVIQNNTLDNIPYDGISSGWGWGTNSYAQNNRMSYNLIYSTVQAFYDGGGIYTLSSQPNSSEDHNYIHTTSAGGRGLYHDEGSQHFTDTYNVIASVGHWLSMWETNIRYNTIEYNYVDVDNPYCNGGPSNQAACNVNQDVVKYNTFTNGNWPAAAKTIMSQAGGSGA
jgi:Right handed beta helix region